MSSIRLLTAALAALPLAAILAVPGTASDPLEIGVVDGGQDYYRQFSNSLPSDSTYFPIGVWFQRVASQADIDLDKDAGINLYVVLSGGSNLALIEKNGMRAILQQSEWRNNRLAISSHAVVGWELFDEVDMQQGPARGYATLSDIAAQVPNDGRMRYNNYGKGVMFWETDAQAARFVNEFQHVVSNDVYWFTDPHFSASFVVRWLDDGRPLGEAQIRRAANYGYTVDRMRALDAMDGVRRPVWNVVEVGWPYTETAEQGGRAIAPAEARAAVWHSIIAGARGIIYFNHSFSGPNRTDNCLRDPAYAAMRTTIRSTNQLIKRLAPVLNAPIADGYVSVNPSIRTMAKVLEGKHYVFAGSRENAASTAVFSLSGIEDGTATVVGENRTISISHGQFSDGFEDGNAIHIYAIEPQSAGKRS